MKEYSFDEATPLIDFIQKNRDRIIGKTLNNLYINYWPEYTRYVISDEPVILSIDDYCIVLDYILISDFKISIGKKEEVMEHEDWAFVVDCRNHYHDYFCEEFQRGFERGVEREYIEGCKITDIKVDRFSEAFEYTLQGDMRPDGGDYFSTISLYLDSGVILSFCGEAAMMDGYIRVWC